MAGQQLVNRGNYVSAVDIVMLTVTADTESSGHVSRVPWCWWRGGGV